MATLVIEPAFFLLVLAIFALSCVGLCLVFRMVRRDGATWFEVAPQMAFLVLIAGWIMAAAAAPLVWSCLPRRASRAGRASRYNILRTIQLCVADYRADHDGAWPPTFKSLYPDYLDYPDRLIVFEDEQLVYNPPGDGAPQGRIVLYYWPPAHKGVPVVLDDMRVMVVGLDEEGRLVDPGTGAVLRRQGSP